MNGGQAARPGEIRVARIISRLNVGGPAIQAIALTKLMEQRGYRTVLFRGREAPREGSLDDLAARYGVRPRMVASMRREVAPRDGLALARLVVELRRLRPHLVHTHAAKAGTLGRVAALCAFPRKRPVLVHTYHGHSLSGYFSSRRTRLFRAVERVLARRTDVLVAVSEQVRDELVALGVAPVERFAVVPLGLDLAPFLVEDSERERRRAALRAELGIAADEKVVTTIARLVPIKRVDRFLRIAQLVASTRDAVRFVIAGDGELNDELRGSAAARALGDRLIWAGMRRDVPDVVFASDVVALTSDNEGTPVSLIEAAAAAAAAVSTRVGGVASVVLDGRSGTLVDADDEAGFARAVERILDEPQRAAQMGAAGRAHVVSRFALERLVDDLDGLYARLLSGWS